MRHSFTPEQTREGGVAAQKIQAERRRIKPSSAEKLSREKLPTWVMMPNMNMPSHMRTDIYTWISISHP